jgi:hypothetical protein
MNSVSGFFRKVKAILNRLFKKTVARRVQRSVEGLAPGSPKKSGK